MVDDPVIGAAEMAVTWEGGETTGITTPRYVLAAYRGTRSGVETAVRQAASSTTVRVRGPGETPYLRHGDAVLPQAVIKERFGEFAYRRSADGALRLDPGWVADQIVTAEVPIRGRVRCHRAIIPALRGALRELAERNLAPLVGPGGYAGCYTPRLTRSGQSVSRHVRGIAIDLNWPENPVGQASGQDPRLVEVLTRWGFAWGGGWLIPDPPTLSMYRPRRLISGDVLSVPWWGTTPP